MFLGARVLRAQDANLGFGKVALFLQIFAEFYFCFSQFLSLNIYDNFLNIFFLKIWEFFISISELLAG